MSRSVEQAYAAVRERMEQACRRVSRPVDDVRPVAITNFYAVAGEAGADPRERVFPGAEPIPEEATAVPEDQRLHLVVYVDNYHDFEVGSGIPVGTVDYDQARWPASEFPAFGIEMPADDVASWDPYLVGTVEPPPPSSGLRLSSSDDEDDDDDVNEAMQVSMLPHTRSRFMQRCRMRACSLKDAVAYCCNKVWRACSPTTPHSLRFMAIRWSSLLCSA